MRITLDRQFLLGAIAVPVFFYAVYATFLKDSKIFKQEEKKVIKKIDKTSDTNKTKNINKIKIEKGMILFLKYKCNNNSSYCNELAKIYLKQNKQKQAEKIFEKSCNLKNEEGCFYTANIKINKNKKAFEKINEIISNLEFACNKNLAASCNSLANLNLKYFNNKQKAIKLLKKACKLEDQNACYKLEDLKEF